MNAPIRRAMHEQHAATAQQLEVKPVEGQFREAFGRRKVCTDIAKLRDMRFDVFVERVVANALQAWKLTVHRRDDR